MNEPTQPPSPRRCPNCGTPLTGRYCAACGQEDHSLAVPLHRVMLDFLSDQFQFDARIWRTLHLLLFRPGRLTRDYLAGQRQRYIPPVRLYLFISIAFFLALGLLPMKLAQFNTGDLRSVRVVAPGAATRPAAGAKQAAPAAVTDLGAYIGNSILESTQRKSPVAASASGPVLAWMKSHLQAARSDPADFKRRFWGNMPKVLFFLIPVFALLLKVLYVFRKRFYSEHLIFALHYHSMVFFNLLVVSLLVTGARLAPAALAGTLRWIAIVVGAWTWIHVFPALRTAYADTWPRAIFRGSALLFVYSMVVAWGAVGAAMVTLAMS